METGSCTLGLVLTRDLCRGKQRWQAGRDPPTSPAGSGGMSAAPFDVRRSQEASGGAAAELLRPRPWGGSVPAAPRAAGLILPSPPCPLLPALPSGSAPREERGYCSGQGGCLRRSSCSLPDRGESRHAAASGKSLRADGVPGLPAGGGHASLGRRPAFSRRSSPWERYQRRRWLLLPARTLAGRLPAFSCC